MFINQKSAGGVKASTAIRTATSHPRYIVGAFCDDPVNIDHLKKEAAQIGAVAIINLTLELGDGMLSNTVTASCTVVNFNNLH